MTASPRLAAAVALLALPLLVFVSVVYESGRIPISQAIRSSAPTAAIALLPLLVIIWQLRNGSDPLGLAVGIAFPAVVFTLIGIALFRMISGNSEQQLNFLMTILFFWSSAGGAVIGFIFLPAIGWLMATSWRAYGALSPNPGIGFLGLVLGATALAVAVPLNKWKPAARPEVRSFRVDQSKFVFPPIYSCLWRITRSDASPEFPESLDELSRADVGGVHGVCGKWKSYENETHTIAYARRDAGFVLSVTERARRGAPSIRLSLDETGIFRQTMLDPAGREIEKERQILNAEPLVLLFYLAEYAELHASAHPELGYPSRIAGGASMQSIDQGSVKLDRPFEPCAKDLGAASCLRAQGRTFIYTPAFGSRGHATAYSIAVLPKITREPDRIFALNELRSYLRDEGGVVYGTGGPHAATKADPVIPADERSVAATRAAEWVKGREKDLAREAKFRSEHFPKK